MGDVSWLLPSRKQFHLPATVQEGPSLMRRWSKPVALACLIRHELCCTFINGHFAPPYMDCISQPPLSREGVKLALLHLLMSGGPSCTVAGRWSRVLIFINKVYNNFFLDGYACQKG